MRSSGQIRILDAVRGASALYVAAFHAFGYLTVTGDRRQLSHGPARLLREGNPAGLVAFGYYAVLVFFVLSGFVIHLRQARASEHRTQGWLRDYAWRRGIRIYVPLIAALVTTATVDLVGRALFPTYYRPPFMGIPAFWSGVDAPSLAAVPLTLAPTGTLFGSNGALWSVQYEILFYVAYAVLFLVVLARLRIPVLTVLAGGLVLGLAAWLARGQISYPPVRFLLAVAAYFPVWLMGAYLAERYAHGRQLRHPAIVAAAGIVLIGGAIWWSDNQQHWVIDMAWGAGITLLLASAVLRNRDAAVGPITRVLAPTAAWSYSLYLVHMPVLIFLRAAWKDGWSIGPAPVRWGLGLIASLVLALAVWAVAERPSLDMIRRGVPGRTRPIVSRTVLAE